MPAVIISQHFPGQPLMFRSKSHATDDMAGPSWLERLPRELQQQMVGWFGDGVLCAVLPDTPAAGASVFSHSVSEKVARRMPRPQGAADRWHCGSATLPSASAPVAGADGASSSVS